MNLCAYWAYPVRFIPAKEGGYTVIVSGIEGAITEGDDKETAEKSAVSVIADVANYYFDEKKMIPPAPGKKDDEELVRLPFAMALKIALRNELIEQKLSQSELARRLGMSAQLLSQTLDLARTRTSIDVLINAFEAIGKKIDVVIG